ncbi:MAG: fatty acid cis/trans isomerase, partial [Pseudomonadales bacterium]|nr:fatty acid cis/trans isomerase [Pseudomonadales bacterium]
GFHTVLNEGDDKSLEKNLENSTLYQMLRLKQLNPQPRIGMLPDSIDLSLDRAQSCPTRSEFNKYAEKKPLEGMPYAMPNLSDAEYKTLVHWLARGAVGPDPKKVSTAAKMQIKKWEKFFNSEGRKEQLVNRYLYEHLFVAHLHFDGLPNREFYQLVRSSTPPGTPIVEIATVLPTEAPGVEDFYYRFRPLQSSIVAKDHVVYTLSDQRMSRYRELFLEPDYEVSELALFQQKGEGNPLEVFAEIPQESRYRFLLDEAHFFIEGFIKGPVCRGQIALNVIEDNFWVVFADPDADLLVNNPEFVTSMVDNLVLPPSQESTFDLLRTWTSYRDKHQRYTEARFAANKDRKSVDIDDAMNFIWDGDGKNANAALTIFRHFDSASVRKGLVGDYPETAWIIEYPQLERIHYLLVADFNVYGNAGHQLTSRLYMDFLRMEGEDNFLSFLPSNRRKEIHDSWYSGVRSDKDGRYKEAPDAFSIEVVSGYKTADPQLELYKNIQKRLAKVVVTDDFINRCHSSDCVDQERNNTIKKIDIEMRKIQMLKGEALSIFPDVTLVRVKTGEPLHDLSYTLIRNKAYKTVSSIFSDEQQRNNLLDFEHDTLTVIRGVEGSYPNFFFVVELDEVEQFASQAASIKDRYDYEKFVAIYGVRRTNGAFWEEADWFQKEYLREQPMRAGILDLNRYMNR